MHWILNPGIAFNELVLGQRLPKRILVCLNCELPLKDRQYVPCPSCGAINDGKIWAGKSKNRFGNWRGLVCPACGEFIPCLWNLTSLVFLVVLFPFWYLPYQLFFINRKPLRPSNKIPIVVEKSAIKSVIEMALSWTIFMWIALSAIPFLWNMLKYGKMDFDNLIIESILWPLGGLFVGVTMHWFLNQKGGNPKI
jgi:hypothetical protein